ncbi:MAG: hypothetical protein RIS50_591 [Bacteroidota bacterium]
MKNRLVKSLSTLKKMFVAFVAAMVLFSSNSLSAQRINMIDIIGDVDSVAAAFTKSGLRLVAKNSDDYRLVGKMAGENIELRFYFTPISRMVFKGVVITEKAFAADSVHAAFTARVAKISKRYITPEICYFADGTSVRYVAPTPVTPNAESPLLITSDIQKIAWENMTYFINLRLYCYKRADGRIVTEYVVKNNETKYNAEMLMMPKGGDALGF